jgi:formate hydrogenlyase subunit 3/multisubunit Na+/H+ antiporter MnhD subunit
LTPVVIVLWAVAALLSMTILGIVPLRWSQTTRLVYVACLTISVVVLAVALAHLLSGGPASLLRLAVGSPWLGANFRIDALAAFFLTVISLGGAGASPFCHRLRPA